MLIIDMPMPSRCGECPLFYMDIVTCTVTGKDCTEYGAERPSWCPIKGVLLDEHGDLIDKETAKNAFDSSFLTFRMKDGETMRGFYQRTIDELPVLIAAERKDDEQADC